MNAHDQTSGRGNVMAERTRERALREARRVYADTLATCAQMTPREQAEAAWSPTSHHTVDELEDRIRGGDA